MALDVWACIGQNDAANVSDVHTSVPLHVHTRSDLHTSLAFVLLITSGCAPLSTQEDRAARSSVGCMHAAMARIELHDLPDQQQHCIAAGLIARHCSVSEAMLASVGKEIQDVFGPGDAQLDDLAADRQGIRCAKDANSDANVIDCCASLE